MQWSKYARSVLTFLFCSLFFSNQGIAQSFGLRFSGQEEVQDKRTYLDLSPDKSICFHKNFQLSFDISFPPNYRDYFGYILRIINDKGQNIDFIYDQQRTDSKNFKVIAGKKFSRIAFRLDTNQLFKQWNTFTINYSFSSKRLIFNYNGNQLVENNVELNSSECLKFLFGANQYKSFKTTDAPAMNIKNIKIYDNEKLKYWWKLDEKAGSKPRDVINGHQAFVLNPSWIKGQHSNWKQVQNVSIKGDASVAANIDNEIIYFVGSENLYKYSVRNKKMDSVVYKKTRNLPTGNQSIYDQLSNKLYNFSVDQKKVSVFNEINGQWDTDLTHPASLTEYWHHNKFVSSVDSCLYVIGGYGQLSYKNQVERYDPKLRDWDTLKTKGDQLHPRYLAALGTDSLGTVYMMGGYGSLTGQQMLGPQNYYDFLTYDVKTKTFRTIYELTGIDNDFAFANSLIISKQENAFYGLIFQNNKFNSTLQLLKGSLQKPVYELLGNAIPYEFHDIESFADLFYFPSSKKLIAVTLFKKDNNRTTVKVYSIDFPPAKLGQAEVKADRSLLLWVIGLISSAALIFVFFYFRSFFFRKKETSVKPAGSSFIIGDTQPEIAVPPIMADTSSVSYSSSILLFGNLQVFDTSGNDITKMFTPLLKELLLIIVIYTIRWNRGVSSEKLNELLWQDKSEKDARNNRSVNIAKLKALLEKVGTSHLSKDTGYWKIDLNTSGLFIDYNLYTSIVKRKEKLEKQNILDLISIIKRGSFLSNAEYEWLDDLKSEVSNEIINILLNYARLAGIQDDPEFIILLMNYIFYFDLVNEEAMVLKCKALVYLGKHTLASNTLDRFKKEYKVLYGEEYNKSFNEIVENI